MATVAATDNNFDIGRVFTETFGTIGKNFVPFAILGLLAEIPSAAFVWFSTGSNPFANNTNDLIRNGAFTPAYAAAIFGGAVLAFVFTFILQAALIHGTVVSLNGRKASFGDCLKTGLNAFFPVLAIGILAGLGFLLGFLLLVVPGVILFLGWAVAVPVRVVERKPVFEVFGRSWELTRGHRWAILGIYVIVAIGSGMLQMVATPLAGLSGLASAGGASVVYVAVAAVIRILIATFGATLAGVMYYELRYIKEGIGPEALASVFD